MLSAANLGIEDTNSSQFFITVAPCASLDGYHTCFGKVLRGFGTVKEVRKTAPCDIGLAISSESSVKLIAEYMC